MSKFNMNNYEDFLKEEARQDRLQESLERKRELESSGSEYDWWAWQQKQKEEEESPYEYDDFDDYDWDDYYDEDYQDDDLYYPDCEDGYGPEYDPYDLLDYDVPECDTDQSLERLQIEHELDLMEADLKALGIEDASPTEWDLYDMYTYAYYEDDVYCDSEDVDPWEEELLVVVQKFDEDTVEEERICRKSVALNRSMNKVQAKKRNKIVAEIIKEQHHISRKKNRKRRKRLKKLLKKAS